MTTPSPAEQLGVTLHESGVPITAAPFIATAADGTTTVTVPSSDPSSVLRHLDTVLAHTGALRVLSTRTTDVGTDVAAAEITVTAVPHVSEPARVADTRVATVGGSSTWHGGIGHYAASGSVAVAEALDNPTDKALGGINPLAMIVPARTAAPAVSDGPAADAAPYLAHLSRLRDDDVFRSMCKAAGVQQTSTAPIPGARENEATRATVTALPTLQAARISPRGLQLVFGAIPTGIAMSDWQKGLPHIAASVGVDPAQASVAALPDGRVLFTSGDRDPLAGAALPTSVGDVPTDADSLYIGVREDGTDAVLHLPETPSLLVSGLSRTGKTAAVLSALAPVIASRPVELVLASGKDATDLDALAPAAREYIVGAGIDERKQLADAMESMWEEASRRSRAFRDDHGTPNYWGVPADQRPPLMVLVLDEAHRYLTGTAASADGKAAAPIKEKLNEFVTAGGSLGVLTILISQRPSHKALDADLRENITAAVALRQSTTTARMSLGEGEPWRDDPSLDPSRLPLGVRGRAVATVGEGDQPLARVQLLHLSDAAITAALPTPQPTTDGKAA